MFPLEIFYQILKGCDTYTTAKALLDAVPALKVHISNRRDERTALTRKFIEHDFLTEVQVDRVVSSWVLTLGSTEVFRQSIYSHAHIYTFQNLRIVCHIPSHESLIHTTSYQPCRLNYVPHPPFPTYCLITVINGPVTIDYNYRGKYGHRPQGRINLLRHNHDLVITGYHDYAGCFYEEHIRDTSLDTSLDSYFQPARHAALMCARIGLSPTLEFMIDNFVTMYSAF